MFDHPTNIFVAGFIGMPQMNFFDDAELVKEGNSYLVKIQGAVVPLPEKKAKALAANNVGSMKVVAGVRPPHAHLVKEAAPDAVTATVDVSEMMGSEIHLHVNAQGKDIVLIIPTTELAEEWHGGIPYGTTIHFTFPGDLIHLFDPETENNLI